MGQVVLVRHGQARADDLANYDNLSDHGAAQARALGEHLAARGTRVDRVVMGPLRRHRQTWEALASTARAGGLTLPEPELEPLLDEHDGLAVFHAALPSLIGDPRRAALLASAHPRERFAVFREAMEMWAREEIASPGETFGAYRARAAAAVRALTDPGAVGTTTLAVTSAGLVAGAVGALLELSDAKVLAVNWAVFNASLTDMRFTSEWAALERFNATPHLSEAMLTKV